MRLVRRRIPANGIDHELIWLVVSVTAPKAKREVAALARLPLGTLYGLAMYEADAQWITDDLMTTLAPALDGYCPNQVIAVAADPATSAVELMRDRAKIGGHATAYVCRGFACRMPVTEPDALRLELGEAAPST